jgi:hypothetical protein
MKGMEAQEFRKAIREYLNKFEKSNKSLYSCRFSYVLTGILDDIKNKKKDFDDKRKNKIEKLDNTPLTRKDYEAKLQTIKAEQNPFEELLNREYDFMLIDEIVSNFLNKRLTGKPYNLPTPQVEEVANILMDRLDFYSLLYFFKNGQYTYRDNFDYNDYYSEDNDLPLSPYHKCRSSFSKGCYVYQDNMIEVLLPILVQYVQNK